jgi:uncharacterized membrane protein
MNTGWEIFSICAIIVGVAVLYFLPSFIAWNKPNGNTVMTINLFLGWTFVGWVIALALSFWNTEQKVIIQQAEKKEDNLDKIAKLKLLRDSNAITEDEYNNEKSKLLGHYKVRQ